MRFLLEDAGRAQKRLHAAREQGVNVHPHRPRAEPVRWRTSLLSELRAEHLRKHQRLSKQANRPETAVHDRSPLPAGGDPNGRFPDVMALCNRCYYKVNLIKRLFSGHRDAERTSSAHVNWPGQSGKGYQFAVYPLDASFRPLPGVYIYAGRAEDGSWFPIYIAQTRDLHQRLEGYVRMDEAVANGATHLHAHYCSAGQAARCTEEHDLILRWHPVCNEPIEP